MLHLHRKAEIEVLQGMCVEEGEGLRQQSRLAKYIVEEIGRDQG